MLQPPVFTGTPGVVPDMTDKEPIDFFHLFFDQRVLDLIHSETIRYTAQYLEREREHLDTHPRARAQGSTYPEGSRGVPSISHRHGYLWFSHTQVGTPDAA